MSNVTFDQVPSMVGLLLEKMEAMEKELSFLKSKYESAPELPADHDELLTIQEALSFLKVSGNTLHRWKRDGVIPFIKIGTRTYFKKSALENYNKIDVKKPKMLRR